MVGCRNEWVAPRLLDRKDVVFQDSTVLQEASKDDVSRLLNIVL